MGGHSGCSPPGEWYFHVAVLVAKVLASGGVKKCLCAPLDLAYLVTSVCIPGKHKRFTWDADISKQKSCEVKRREVESGVYALANINAHQLVAGYSITGQQGRPIHPRKGEHHWALERPCQGARLAEVFRFPDSNTFSNGRLSDFAVCGYRLVSLSLYGVLTIWNLKTRSRMAEFRTGRIPLCANTCMYWCRNERQRGCPCPEECPVRTCLLCFKQLRAHRRFWSLRLGS